MHITIASMGPGGHIDNSILSAARAASAVVVQTDISDKLQASGIAYESLDPLFDDATDFDDLISRANAMLMRDGLMFVALGSLQHNRIACALAQCTVSGGGRITALTDGDAALRIAFEHGLVSGSCGIMTHTASTFERACDTDAALVVNEIDTQLAASELKLKLSRFYGDEYPVLLMDIRGGSADNIPLCRLDSAPVYGYFTSVFIPPVPLLEKARYTFSDLVSIMRILRSQNGCPWDREQTHTSLKRYLVEESYEVLEAIDDDDMDALYDELGDVLLQVVFHARIAEQRGEFDDTDITTAECSKMISRHTHIFGSADAQTPEDVVNNWEQIKKDEKGQQSQTEVLLSVPKSMPALMRSEKVQHKAAKIGFDFRHISEAVSKLREEITEVEQDIDNPEKLAEECGDLIFSAVNVSRLAGVEPETALQKATDKFIARFQHVERIANEKKVDMTACSLETLDDIWDEAKKNALFPAK